MKLLVAILAGALPLSCACLQAREFKSADGQQTINAEFVRYNQSRNEVTLRMPNGQNMITDAKRFSEEDRKFFMEQAVNEALSGALKARAHDRITRDTELIEKLVYSYTMARYEITVENKSEIPLEDLNLKFWVLVERNQEGKSTNEIASGESPIKKLDAKSEQSVPGPTIKLITGAVANVNSEKDAYLVNKAATVGRDRAIGYRIEIYDSSGKRVYADSSSTRVDKALGIDEKK